MKVIIEEAEMSTLGEYGRKQLGKLGFPIKAEMNNGDKYDLYDMPLDNGVWKYFCEAEITSLEQLIEIAKKTNRKLVIDFNEEPVEITIYNHWIE